MQLSVKNFEFNSNSEDESHLDSKISSLQTKQNEQSEKVYEDNHSKSQKKFERRNKVLLKMFKKEKKSRCVTEELIDENQNDKPNINAVMRVKSIPNIL
jgi:hypothetical protein